MAAKTYQGPDGLTVRAVWSGRGRHARQWFLVTRPGELGPLAEKADTVEDLEALGVSLADLEVAA